MGLTDETLVQAQILGLWLDGREADDSPTPGVANNPIDVRIRLVNMSESWDKHKGDYSSMPCHARLNLTLGPLTSQKWKAEYVHPRAYYEQEADLKPDDVKDVKFKITLPVGWEPEEVLSLAVQVTVHVKITPTSYYEEVYDYLFRNCLQLLSPGVEGQTEWKEKLMQGYMEERLSA